VTSQEPKTPQSADRDIPDTEVLVVSAPSPVFVDSTGRRRRRLQRVAYAFGAVCALYGGVISVSLAGGPISSTAIRSLPDLPDHEVEPGRTRPSPTPEPTASTPPKTRFISESLPRDLPVPGGRRVVAPKPPAPPPPPKTSSAKPAKTPAPGPTTTRPAATTPAASSSATPSASSSVVAPKPPSTVDAPSPSTVGTGGNGSGRATATQAPSSGSGSADPAPEPTAGAREAA
jgi:hypothetical protein